MKSRILLAIITIFLHNKVVAQTSYQFGWSPSTTISKEITIELPDNQDDPAYRIYKEGYSLVLDEQWDEARKKFADVLTKYPKSNYGEHAKYWTAYALKHTNRKKAIEAYNKFIADYPKSRYYDDAVADLAELKNERTRIVDRLTVKEGGRVYVTEDGLFLTEGKQAMNIGPGGIVIGEGPDSVVIDSNGIIIESEGKSFSYAYGNSPKAKTLEKALVLHAQRLSKLSMIQEQQSDNAKLNPDVQLKMDALYALGKAREDESSFQTLKEVVLDLKQPPPLRTAAIHVLSGFRKFDVLPIFAEVVKNDSNEDVQGSAIYYISQNSKDKNKTVDILISLFNALPPSRAEQCGVLFYHIANIGNSRAVDFLANVAQTNEDYELRRQAVYYLGSIGGEKARTELYKILKGK